MLLNTDFVDPAVLTGYVRAAEADRSENQFSLDRFLPNSFVDDLEFRFNRGGEGLTEAATYRAYDAESPIGGRAGVSRVTGELPPLSRKIRLTEYDRIRQRALDRQGDEMTRALLRDGVRMTRSIGARMELARGDALVNGKVSIAENGVSASVDFGRNAAHSVTAATVWSDPAAHILTDLRTWRETYKDTNDGDEPGAALTSQKVFNTMLLNSDFRALLASLVGTPSIITEASVRQVLAAHGLPPIYIYDAKVRVGGVATRIIPEDRFLFLPAPASGPDGTDLGATLWGTTVEATDSRYGLAGTSDAPGVVAGVYETEDPKTLWTKAGAIGLPILANPDLSFVADVL
ncbi:major capsid protein [Kitasatospora sp. NPDC050543]|uniref:major capsid protein n=1 Tax=Kitasatospora sp. NPDC050543 TaxID=3364054 RepID=UPI0037B1B248